MNIFPTRSLLIALCAAGLTACSSKPDTADIQKELAAAFDCPILELSDVKKVDGAEVDNKHYDVAFTYTMSIKGGLSAATNLFAEWHFLSDQIQLANMAEARARLVQRDEKRVDEIVEMKKKMVARSGALMPCQTPLADIRIGLMVAEFAIAAKSGQSKVAIPFSEKMYGVARMGKVESGWRFVGMPNLTLQEIVKSEPVTYPTFKPLVTEEAKSSTSEQDITARGKLISGRLDSILEGENGGGPSFMTQSAVAKEIFAVCGDGDICEVQGRIDPSDGFLTSVTSVKKIN